MQTGETTVVRDLGDHVVSAGASSEQDREAIRRLGLRGMVSVPIRNGPRVVGALTFVTAESGRTLMDDDVALAEEIGRRASAAVTNSLLYARLTDRGRQQAAVALLGQAALEGAPLQALFEQAATLVADTLGHEYAAILIVEAGRETLRRLAGVGWDRLEGVSDVVAVASSTQVAYTLESGEPVVVDDLADEVRFPPSKALLTAGVRASLSVPIGRGPSVGVLTTHSLRRRHFRDDDINFLTATANVLATAIEHERVRQQEAKTSALRDAFIGVISHELRTPITTIYGSTKVLTRAQSRLTDAERRDVLADIEAEAERLRRLVEDLLVLSRAERGRVEVQTDPILMSHVIARVVRSEEARLPGTEFLVQVDPGVPAVSGEETYIEQILRNFVANAAKYGGTDAPIEIRTEVEGEFVAVRVLDRGPGISPDEADQLFELFYRSSATASQASGAGIGLFVSRELVEAMGGTAWAAPRDGGGAEFGFRLPVYGLDED
jgi:signal transduction histidine kinase